jgi:RNA polymerase sigma factor (sigma-70 family)
MDNAPDLDRLLAALKSEPELESNWSRLCEVLAPYLLTVAHQILGVEHGHAAEDVVQETWTQLARAPIFSKFENFAKLRSYAAAIARSRAYDVLRRNRRSSRDAEIVAHSYDEVRSYVEEVYAADEMLRHLRSKLRPVEQVILDEVLLGGGANEVARAVDVSAATARVKLHRLRLRVRALLDLPSDPD